MGYRDIYKESNEQAEERFLLVMERIAEIAEETDVPEKFDDYFKKTAAFLLQSAKNRMQVFMMTSKRKIMEKVMEIRLMQ